METGEAENEKRRAIGSPMSSSLLRKPGVVALAVVGAAFSYTVVWVHRSQTRERLAMREAVLRDIEKLEKRKQ